MYCCSNQLHTLTWVGRGRATMNDSDLQTGPPDRLHSSLPGLVDRCTKDRCGLGNHGQNKVLSLDVSSGYSVREAAQHLPMWLEHGFAVDKAL